MASRGTMAWAAHGALALTILVALGACGDDDGGGDETDAGAGEGGSGGSTAGRGGSGGSGGTSTAGSGGTSGGAGGTGGAMAMCDTSIPTTATCGGTSCPASTSPVAMFTCSVPCCTEDDECGLRNAIDGMVTACVRPDEEDPSCPGYSGMYMGRPLELPGCCTADDVCGAISSITLTCITSSVALPDLTAGGPCGDGASDGGN